MDRIFGKFYDNISKDLEFCNLIAKILFYDLFIDRFDSLVILK